MSELSHLQSPFAIEFNPEGDVSYDDFRAAREAELAYDIANLAIKAPDGAVWMQLAMLKGDETARESFKGTMQDAAEAEDKANFDPLSGLRNRRSWNERLDAQIEELEEDDAAAILFIDLDGFKGVNDNFGHDAGDRALQRVGAYLRQDIRVSPRNQYPDSAGRNDPDMESAQPKVTGRLGGDEFLVFVRLSSEQEHVTDSRDRRKGALSHDAQLEAIERRLVSGIEQVADELELPFSASVGHALWKPGMNASELTKVADSAMFVKKAARKQERIEALDPEEQQRIADAQAVLREHGLAR